MSSQNITFESEKKNPISLAFHSVVVVVTCTSLIMGKEKKTRAQSAATPASTSISTATVTMPTASTSLSQPREITLFCWILGISDRSFSINIEDNLTVDHLKDAIVKKNPVSFQGVDPYELDLWDVSGFPPVSTSADNFPTRHPFRSTGNSKTRLATENFLKRMCYWRETR